MPYSPIPTNDRLMVFGYHQTNAGYQELLWTSLSDEYYALNDIPTMDFNYAKAWDPGQDFSLVQAQFLELTNTFRGKHHFNDYGVVWRTDGNPRQLTMLRFRCKFFSDFTCVHNEVPEEGEHQFVYFWEGKFDMTLPAEDASAITDWHYAHGGCLFDD